MEIAIDFLIGCICMACLIILYWLSFTHTEEEHPAIKKKTCNHSFGYQCKDKKCTTCKYHY